MQLEHNGAICLAFDISHCLTSVSALGPSTLRSLRSACLRLCSTGVAPTQTSVTASVWTWTSATFWASGALCFGCSVFSLISGWIFNYLKKKQPKSDILFILFAHCFLWLQRSVWTRPDLMNMSKELLNWHRRQV